MCYILGLALSGLPSYGGLSPRLSTYPPPLRTRVRTPERVTPERVTPERVTPERMMRNRMTRDFIFAGMPNF